MAGVLYNSGNLLLFLTPLLLGQGSHLWATYLHHPLPPVSAGLFFCSGIAYGLARVQTGHRISGTAALVLALDLLLRGHVAGGLAVLVLHAGGRFVGSFPVVFGRLLGPDVPGRVSGIGPLLSRIPVAADVVRSGNWLLGCACLLWLCADLCLTWASFARVRRSRAAAV